MQNRSPNTSPRMSRRLQQQQSPGRRDTSFDSYRDQDEDEVDRSDDEDEVDRSIQSHNLSRGSAGHFSDIETPSPFSHKSDKGGTSSLHGRRGLRDPNSSKSPNKFGPSPKRSPEGSERDAGSPQSIHSHSSGSPSLYPNLDDSGVSNYNLYPDLDKMIDKSPLKDQIRPGYMKLRPRPTAQSGRTGRDPTVSPTKTGRGSSQPKKTSSADSTNQILQAVILILFALAFIFWYNSKAESPKEQGSTLERFIERQQELEKKFPGQDRRLWKTLSAATKRIINDEEPIQPAVILIGSTKAASREADCIAQQFSKVVTEAFQSSEPVSVDVSSEYRAVSPDDAKVALERSFKNGFGGGAKSAVISSLEDLPGSTAMLLHAFCDNDNAPYTKVVILFTIHIDESYISSNDVEDHLTKIWKKHLNIDDISALLSRVANNIVIVKEEDKAGLQQHCTG